MAAEEPKKSLAPELEEVVQAGDTLIIRDNNNKEFAITGRDSDEVIDFFKAFDEWLSAQQTGTLAPELIAQLWKIVIGKFRALPDRIQWQLPSYKNMGLTVPGHTHG